MKLINISEENLEELREKSIDNKCTIPYLIFVERSDNRSILIFIELGKYKNYFSHVEVLFNGNIKKLKLLIEYRKEELQYENLKNSCEDIDTNFSKIIKETLGSYRTYRKPISFKDLNNIDNMIITQNISDMDNSKSSNKILKKLNGSIIIGQVSEPGPITKTKLQIIQRVNRGETFTLIDNDGEYIKLAKSLNSYMRKLENGTTEITFNPEKL